MRVLFFLMLFTASLAHAEQTISERASLEGIGNFFFRLEVQAPQSKWFRVDPELFRRRAVKVLEERSLELASDIEFRVAQGAELVVRIQMEPGLEKERLAYLVQVFVRQAVALPSGKKTRAIIWQQTRIGTFHESNLNPTEDAAIDLINRFLNEYGAANR